MERNIDLLKQTSIFDGLNDEEFNMVLGGCMEHVYPMGTIIIRENDTPKRVLFIVKEGEIAVSSSATGLVEEGSSADSLITTLGQGDIFGEVSLIDNDPHSANIRAITDATLLLLPESHFSKLAEEDKNIGYVVIRNIAKILCHRLRDTNFSIRFGLSNFAGNDA